MLSKHKRRRLEGLTGAWLLSVAKLLVIRAQDVVILDRSPHTAVKAVMVL